MRLIVLIGASGSGKTTLARRLEKKLPKDAAIFLYFDRIFGTKPFGVVVENSDEDSQRIATETWCKIIARDFGEAGAVILDGQTRWSFVQGGCFLAGLPAPELILIDCEDAERTRRLTERRQPELANQQMMDWAKWLRNDAAARRFPVLDTTNKGLGDCETRLLEIIGI
jgi:adenylate kinase family enzyme